MRLLAANHATKKVVCKYCRKTICASKYLKRHYKSCPEYSQHGLNQKISELTTKTEALTTKTEEQAKELAVFRKAEKEYVDVIKMLAKNNSNVVNISNSTINNTNSYGIYYIMRNYKDALNFEDVMKPALTADEIAYTRENGAASGCCKLILDRCITDIAIEKRPFHCTDLARKKYVLHTENDWKVDDKGEMILNKTYPKIRKLYQLDQDIDSLNAKEFNAYTDDCEQVSQLYKNRKKIVNILARKTYLKNNIKDIKAMT
uniref:Cholesterol-binding START domain containing protein n=1 Tax=Mimivirus LCMiAC01 TaxID=2506608 RepID=A0A481Z208_9VIRU|nr:MAG: cholesterol-binding START domain containing protein [Mimivirus LCMiAC01]